MLRALSFVLALSLALPAQVALAQSYEPLPAAPLPASDGIDAELNLFESVIALEGVPLNSDRFRDGLKAAVTTYDRESAAEGRPDRLVAALVRLQLLDEAQATSYLADVRDAADSGRITDPATFARLMKRYRPPVGHAFSSDELEYWMVAGGMAIAIVGGAAGMILNPNQPAAALVPWFGGILTCFSGLIARCFTKLGC